MRDVTKLNIKQLDVCVSMCEHGVNMHLYKAVILTLSAFIYHHYYLSIYKLLEFSSQSGVILEHYTALIITLPHKGLGRYTD